MPIYEFRCSSCHEVFEILTTGADEEISGCPHCNSEVFERVISSVNYSMGGGSGQQSSVSSKTRSCSSGSCTTYTIPGVSG